MTSHQQVSLDAFESATPAGPERRETVIGTTWFVRMRALLFAGRYDAQVEAGVPPVAGGPLAAHWVRLTSARERQDLACALRTAVRDSRSVDNRLNSRVPVRASAVGQARHVIDEVVQRLTDQGPVRARGTARLRILLADGRGPMYRAGPGTLTAALHGVLAAL